MKKVISFKNEINLIRAIDILKENNIEFDLKYGYDAMIDDEVESIANMAFDDGYTFAESDMIADIFRAKIESYNNLIDSDDIQFFYDQSIKEFKDNRKTIA